jgi:hypothetical protein
VFRKSLFRRTLFRKGQYSLAFISSSHLRRASDRLPAWLHDTIPTGVIPTGASPAGSVTWGIKVRESDGTISCLRSVDNSESIDDKCMKREGVSGVEGEEGEVKRGRT